ncbi:acylneuraminate cytidylyltransferase family protein [Candidatus Sororendozoicomonas aggregata]|uniref:acylneuraminate cytidylyltransferase family protein n=1 Tax=Candidatus Sororendozoicomonas aggregata TaxID=3073239 RepID=UPI002ED3918F
MINDKRVLSVIPARAGSKRLPNKNMRHFHGVPLVQKTISAATESEFIDAVVVSSDSKEIVDFSIDLGVLIHKRHHSLAKDTSTSIDVALNVLSHFSGFDIIVWLQPTSPLRTVEDVDEALSLFETTKADTLVSVCESAHSPLWMSTLSDNGILNNFKSLEATRIRSQELKKYYLINGAIYISTIISLKENKAFTTNNSYAYIMPPERSIDIDTALDFKLAELIYLEQKDDI